MNSSNQDKQKGKSSEPPVKRYRVRYPKAALFILVFILPGAFFTVLDGAFWTPYVTNQNHPVEQTIPFSHKHHANMGIDCRYCHTSVEEGAIAGVPTTRTCMNCHSMIWNQSPMLQPVRDSWTNNVPLEWNRVHDLPDFVYFNHSIHIKKGIGCSTCHGRVDQMPLMRKQNTLNMKWCTDCHKAPEQFIRPRSEVFNMAYQAPANQLELGNQLVKEYKVDRDNQHLAQCYKCHR